MPGERTQTTGTAASSTIIGRLSTTRGRAVFYLLVLLTPLLTALAVNQTVVRTRLPDVGLDVNADTAVEGVDQRWPGVVRGDRIVALDGHPIESPADWVKRSLSHDETPLLVTFERDAGERRTLSAKATPIRTSDRLAVWLRVITGAALMVMGLIAFVARPGTATTWLLMALAWNLGAFILLKIGLYFDPRLYKQVHLAPWCSQVAFGLHLICYFPQKLPWIAARPLRALLFYIPVLPALFVPVSWVTPLVVLGTISGVMTVGLFITVMVSQYLSIRRSANARAHAQYRALLVAFSLGLLVPAVWNFLRFVLDIGSTPWISYYNTLPLAFFGGMMCYAVVRHNTLAIDRFTAAVVGYGTTTMVLGAVFAGALLAIPLLVDRSGLTDSAGLLVVVTAVTFLGFAPLHRRIKRWVDRRFFREQADAAQIADALRLLVQRMQRRSQNAAFQAALEATGILNCERVELWLLSEEGRQLHRSLATSPGVGSPSLAVDGPLARALKQGAAGGLEGLSPRCFGSAAEDELWSKELAMAAPVMVLGAMAGFLAVGRKRSGVGYELEEMSFLTVAAAQLGPVLERSRLEGSGTERYPIERRLGTGGMAEVFLAWQVGPGGFERKVALKRPLPHVSEDPNAVAAFLDEARLAAQLHHPAIAQVYDVGESAGRYFIVMEYVDGPSLRQLLRRMQERKEQVPIAIASAIIVSVLAALDYAHSLTDPRGRPLKLVHRDVTPRNVLLNRRGQVKLVDFGIARAQFQRHVTRTGTVKGTVAYMSLEQASGGRIDQRSDLYSVGVMFYELLTGQVAYPDGPMPAWPSHEPAAGAELSTELEAVVRRSMHFEKKERFGWAADQARAVIEAIKPVEPATPDEVASWMLSVCPELTAIDSSAAAGAPAPRAGTIPEADLTLPQTRAPWLDDG